jgi:hypothetical protein
MEMYVHLLIAADPGFTPNVFDVASFFDQLQTEFGFECIRSKKDWMPGLTLFTSAERALTMKDSYTGEERSMKVPKTIELEKSSEIPSLISGEPKYGVRMSGRWPPNKPPIHLLLTDGTSFDQGLVCFVGCFQTAAPVCTGDWRGAEGSGAPEFVFGDQKGPIQPNGVFTNPWTGQRVEVPGAGSARFWVEFQFGKWLFPRINDNFDILSPALVATVEKCFGIAFIQAGCGRG